MINKLCLPIILLLTLCFVLPLSAQRKKNKEKAPEEIKKHYLDTVSLAGLKFRNIGPALTSGRISDFAVHPQNRSIYYVATASGGVWKTSNAGTTFQPIFDSQDSYSTGCITMDPNNPHTIWVGTGENNSQRSVGYGDGVYKSEDGGQSWKNMGLKNSAHIGKIIVDPRNSDVVFVAAMGPLWSEGGERGLYKTTDGGKTWELILEIDEHTGVTDIVMDPRDPDMLYAAAYQRRRHVFTYIGGGPASGIFRSKDGGANWETINKGLPSGDIGRIGIAISPVNPDILYAIVEAEKGKSGFFRSTNRGASWEKRNTYFTVGLYYSEIFTHPTDPDIVYVMDTYNHWTTDGGKTFKRLGESNKHVDNHVIWIDPNDTDYYLVGCDGGIYESFDAAKTWNYKPNLPITQFYKVAVDNDRPFYNVYGGTQDNFSLGGPSRTINNNGIVNSDWYVTQGGDGFESAIDTDNPNIVYAQYQHGGLTRYDRASGEQTALQPKPSAGEDAYRWNWDAPLVVSAYSATRLYFAANKLFRTDNRGDKWTAISPDLTRQLDRNTLPVMGKIQSIDAVAKHGSTGQYGTIVAFSESSIDQDLLYVGTDDGLIQITEDGGKNWMKIDCNDIPGVPERTYVNFLLASQHDVNVVYAVFNHHKYGDFKPYVFKSTDKGRSWTSITTNLPKRGSAYSLAEDHANPNLLFCGTEFSLFFTNSGGEHWKKFSSGLPTIAVRDIAIQKRENDLVLATFGRGFYVLDDYSPLRELSKEKLAADGQIFSVKDGLMYIERSPMGRQGNAFQGHNFYRANNPPIGATFTYFTKESNLSLKQQRQQREKELRKAGAEIRYPTYEELRAESKEEKSYLEFTIRDAVGNIVRKITTSDAKGVKRLVWSGRYASLNPIQANENIEDGIMALPGDYTVSLVRVAEGERQELASSIPFKLKALEGVTLPATDRAALVDFQKEAAELMRAYAGVNSLYRSVGEKVKSMKKAILAVPNPSSDWQSKIQAIEDELYEINQTIFGDRLATRLDKDTPPGIGSRISGVANASYRTTSAPTETMKDEVRLAGEAFGPVLQKLKTLVNQHILQLERKLEEAGAPYTPGRMIEWGKN